MDIKKFEKKTRYARWQRKRKRKLIKEAKKGKSGQIVLLGDSITELFNVKLLDGCSELEIYNSGLSGDTTNRMIERLEETVLCLKPSQLVLLVGTNDFSKGADVEYVFENIKRIVEIIRGDNPSVAVTLECVYPVDSSKKGLESGRNEKIEKLNSMLKIYAEGEGLGLLDLTESLKSENGAFSSQNSDDGLHPNENGFAIVAEGLKSVLK